MVRIGGLTSTVEHKVPESLIKMILGIEVDSNTLEESISRMGGRIVGKVRVGQEAIGSKWDGTKEDDLAYLIQMPAWRGFAPSCRHS